MQGLQSPAVRAILLHSLYVLVQCPVCGRVRLCCFGGFRSLAHCLIGADGGAEHCVEALSLLYEDFNPATDAERITKWSGLPCH